MKTIRALVTAAVTLVAAAGISVATAPSAAADVDQGDCSLYQSVYSNPQYARGSCAYAPTNQRWRVVAFCSTLEDHKYAVVTPWAWGQGYTHHHGEGVPVVNSQQATCNPGDALLDATIETG
ncbi:hypothetical protein DR950_06670 [Kitasatospora xanthocidica]|uniref:Secreted protein n=1 Tax=Kitasatospora xanthocidica TaxID=83382 RepID=A0A372ZQ36_9ACTN|nr:MULTISPECIES: hypothetical protein [Kitasatospora]RGD57520.1 hypothetical protein DR950_06670 [Kitasatospora xanthocidica]